MEIEIMSVKCTYQVLCQNKGSNMYGYTIEKTKIFPTITDAVTFSKRISNTNVVIGIPTIDFLENKNEIYR